MLPFLEVSHLPSSASFYSAILQPLGLHYIANGDGDGAGTSLLAPPLSITYGSDSPPAPALQIREAAELPKLSHITLSAASPSVVADFEAAAHRAEPTALIADRSQGLSQFPEGGETRATVCDFDGNTMEVAYIPPSDYPAHHSGSTVRRTQSSQKEISRILDWNYDVATSVSPHQGPNTAVARQPPLAMARRPTRYDGDEPYTILRRTVTTSTIEPSPRQSPTSNGLSAGAVVSTLFGVAAGAAAGAAITYGLMKNERNRAPRQEFDTPVFQRRSTFPDQLPSDQHRGRYVEVERIEKIRYPEYVPVMDRRPPPTTGHAAKFSEVGVVPMPRSREYDDIYDSRSRHSSRPGVARTQSVRARSEAPGDRAPLLITDREHRSQVSVRPSEHRSQVTARPSEHRSQVTARPSEHRSQVSARPSAAPRSTTHTHRLPADMDRESYVSARSHRSSSTIRAPVVPPAPSVHTEVVTRSRAGSRYTTIKSSTNAPVAYPPSASRTHSHVSAYKVPLPASGVGSSHADWDDDAGSVAPSDSISCVGSSRSHRRGSHY